MREATGHDREDLSLGLVALVVELGERVVHEARHAPARLRLVAAVVSAPLVARTRRRTSSIVATAAAALTVIARPTLRSRSAGASRSARSTARVVALALAGRRGTALRCLIV